MQSRALTKIINENGEVENETKNEKGFFQQNKHMFVSSAFGQNNACVWLCGKAFHSCVVVNVMAITGAMSCHFCNSAEVAIMGQLPIFK